MANVITGDELVSEYGRGTDLLKIPPAEVTYTASHTAQQSDVGKVVYMNSASANSFTIPPDSAQEPFVVNQFITVCQLGAGLTTFVAGAGVTINTFATLAFVGQYAFATVLKRGPNSWIALGNLT